MEAPPLVTISVFVSLSEAQFAKGMLESAGIECFLMDENMVRLDWFLVNMLGGIKLMVAEHDAEAANALINRPTLAYSSADEDIAE